MEADYLSVQCVLNTCTDGVHPQDSIHMFPHPGNAIMVHVRQMLKLDHCSGIQLSLVHLAIEGPN